MIECEEPDVPSGGYVTGFDFTIHSEIVYHCEVGHILSGDTMRKCLPTGAWSGNPPSCTCTLTLITVSSKRGYNVDWLNNCRCGLRTASRYRQWCHPISKRYNSRRQRSSVQLQRQLPTGRCVTDSHLRRKRKMVRCRSAMSRDPLPNAWTTRRFSFEHFKFGSIACRHFATKYGPRRWRIEQFFPHRFDCHLQVRTWIPFRRTQFAHLWRSWPLDWRSSFLHL